MAKQRLTDKSIVYLIKQRKIGKSTSDISVELGITSRHVRRLWSRFLNTKTIPKIRKPGRPTKEPSHVQTKSVLDMQNEGNHMGVVRTAKYLRGAGYNISYCAIYKIMKKHGLVTPSPAKSKRRKWVRFERRFSNAMWHADWHIMKDPRLKGFNLIVYLDDASRCVIGYGVFEHATSENSVLALRRAFRYFDKPAQMLSDNGSQFTSRKRTSKTPKNGWMPTLFEDELLEHGIVLINSRPYHPQTNGKLERFFRTLEEELPYYDSMDEYIGYYNEKRLHFSLDIDHGQTPLMAFADKRATKAIRKTNPKWMEEDTND